MKASTFNLTASEVMSLRDLLTSDSWKVVEKIHDQGKLHIQEACASTGNDDNKLERGIYRGWLMFLANVRQVAAEPETPDADELAALVNAPAGDARGGYEMD